MKLVEQACVSCGAKLPVEPGASSISCKYCSTTLSIEHDDPGTRAGITTAARSDDSRAPVTITFVNRRPGPLDLVWLDFEGNEKSYGRLDPGAEKPFNTYVGHVWSLRDARDEVLRWAARDQVPRRVNVG